MGFLGGLIAFGKWFDQIRNWKNPISTVLVHILFFLLVVFPELILTTFFIYLFLIGIWYYQWRPKNSPHMDTDPDLVRKRNDDDLRTFYKLVDDFATQGERVASLLRWRDPRATTQFLIFCLLASIVMYFIPFEIPLVFVGFYVLRHPKFRHHKLPFNIQDPQQELPKAKETEPSFLVPDPIFQRFTLDQIQSATQNFHESLVVGYGGFGKVYKGHIKDDPKTVVAIKRLSSMSNQGALEFRAEVDMLSKIRHCNLVSLIGYCNEGKEMALVYEYMPEGSLADHLHKVSAPLSWLQLLKICIGAARGLDYLHTGTGTHHGIIHRDVKSSNVLLDKNFVAKISDFGLAKIGPTNQTCTHVSTVVKGTFGYLDPCYVYTGELTRKSDVYSFGVVLLEVICGRPAVDTSLYEEDQWSLAPWAQERIKEGNHNHIVDYRLRGQISGNCLRDFVRIASQCLHNQPNKRPRMGEIVAKLELILSLQEKLNSSITEKKFVDKVMTFIFSVCCPTLLPTWKACSTIFPISGFDFQFQDDTEMLKVMSFYGEEMVTALRSEVDRLQKEIR